MKCQLCGAEVEGILEKHHIIPKSRKGKDFPANILYLCPNCHRIVTKLEREREKAEKVHTEVEQQLELALEKLMVAKEQKEIVKRWIELRYPLFRDIDFPTT
jgi:5-methylcytosine-specific restriction endonuclease McrA